MESFRVGWRAITEKRGIFIIIIVSSVITCFMGAVQILAEPMILDFQTSKVLGIAETVCASGMLVSSVFIGIFGLKKNYTRILCMAITALLLSRIKSVRELENGENR